MKILIPLGILFCISSLIYSAPVEEINAEEADSGVGEYGEHYQGDIVLTPEQEKELLSEGRNGRTGILNTNARWPKVNGFVQVPYVFATGFTSSDISKIRTGMNDIESKTCVRFVPRTNQANYVRVISGNGCNSNIGRIGGQQDVSLQRTNCFTHGTIMHEFIHALGYAHMHTDSRRDSFVRINWGNIQNNQYGQFIKVGSNFGNFGTSYDLDSVMHYGGKAFTKNGGLTIQTLNAADQNKIGQRVRLSSGDITRINRMYNC